MSESYVVVSVAPNGVVHAWGDETGQPHHSRTTAAQARRRIERADRELYPDGEPVRFAVCKLLGSAPV